MIGRTTLRTQIASLRISLLNGLKIRGKRFLSSSPREVKAFIKLTMQGVMQLLATRHPKVRYKPIGELDSLGTDRLPHFEVKVGTILDEFSERAFSPEFELIPLSPTNWRELLKSVDLVFAESAWAGTSGSWRYHMSGKKGASEEIQDLVKEAKRMNIPTVFWNKEDPPHFDQFLKTAKLFDIIFTTDENSVKEYKRLLGRDYVYVLPFAAQPQMHNPAQNGIEPLKRDIAFGGTYFSQKFPERERQIRLLLGAAQDVSRKNGYSFDIFSRHAGGNKKYQFPNEFAGYVRGALNYERMLTAYRSFKLFLNVNTVTDSPTMCSRRIFEIPASGTAVLSTNSLAVRKFFREDEIPVTSTRLEARSSIKALLNSPKYREKVVHRAQRKIWEHHTYKHRALKILKAVDDSVVGPSTPLVSVICSTNRPENIDHLLRQVGQQNYPRIELCLLAHGEQIPSSVQDEITTLPLEQVKVLHLPNSFTLGDCLNELVEHSTGSIIAKFDDDDYYLPNYLRDSVNILSVMEADLTGKATIFYYLEERNLLVRKWPDQEHRWTDKVSGATFVGRRSLFEKVKFQSLSRGEDSAFLSGVKKLGGKVYSADPFNYLAVRHSGKHAWDITDLEIMAYSRVEGFGLNLDSVEV